MAVTNPSSEETLALIKEIEATFPSDLGDDKWEILAVHHTSNFLKQSEC